MRRLLWLGVGLAVGAIVVRKLNQKANEFTPTGIATSLSESAGGLVESLRSFVDDVRDGMAEREDQIHQAFAAGELYEDKFADLRDDAGYGTQEGNR
ncbi:hypothetical protein AMIS_62340 [Actinoplanes missouriensis 431]|uniref:Secreted protein n=1 Tax=Actinoplanes missouriensis (strain ATCC 14538 / DSM 43046 / CBS 188.64 / JCM 3121 / NBRC 102363 / NCIMB 12654 / NRRL B-3342 / UNCC 431) TaxID=512565 RepID=I0HEL7_ACTM4|nr:hypothetical protein [Actinoplanes missouriensis]BAL91454.1 hypothetical protein AMIS_62340 [Actinoplanes missouriensis 431]